LTSYALALLLVLGQIPPRDTPSTDFNLSVHQGRAEYTAGHFAVAARLFNDALAQIQQDRNSDRARILSDLGAAYTKEEEFAKAEKAYSESLAIWKSLGDSDDSALMLHNISMLYSMQGKSDDALRFLGEAQDLIRANPKTNAKTTVQVLNAIAIIHFRNGNLRKAETYFNQALQNVSSSEINFDVAGILNNLGAVYVARHKDKDAEEILHRALAIKEAQLGPSHPDLTQTLISIAVSYTQTKRFAEAEESYMRVIRILEPQSPGFAFSMAEALHGLSTTYVKEGRAAEGEMTLEKAAHIAQLNLDKGREMVTILDEYSRVLKSHGKTKEAEELHAQVSRARAAGMVTKASTAY
jgi:tetratricopeptide (TPR) repeat protein